MLQRLSIRNYVIIDALDIRFTGGFHAITGETGAGKSILMGALGLILGERADAAVLDPSGSGKCVIEGVFDAADDPAVRRFLAGNELESDTEVIIRREVATGGKSRAFINDTPANLTQLQALGSLLVDLHQQFDTQDLVQSDFQRDVLDALAGHGPLLASYRSAYEGWSECREQLSLLREARERWDRESELLRFQFRELDEAGFRAGELEEAAAEIKRLENAGSILQALQDVITGLEDGEAPIVQQLKQFTGKLAGITSYHTSIPELLDRLDSARIELKEVAADLERLGHVFQSDPQRLGLLHERLSLGYRLCKKHGVNDTEGLIRIHRSLDEKLRRGVDDRERMDALEKEENRLQQAARELADAIGVGRKNQVRPLEERVNGLLAQVGMPNARLKVLLQTGQPLQASGSDTVEFLFNANMPPDDPARDPVFAPLRKVASGGERSRLMLCIKSLVASSLNIPTLLFDEIDTGISGEAARQVGRILRELASLRQVICITHQPQVAGQADTHWHVFKETVQGRVRTRIRQLEAEDRVSAIARMLSGEQPTPAALENARELLAR
ncbi:MAG: hypothetical protein RJA57_1087 [Bacteroidota bacterium]|jgi:DNA repair protein RecN (Recombination protein N)